MKKNRIVILACAGIFTAIILILCFFSARRQNPVITQFVTQWKTATTYSEQTKLYLGLLAQLGPVPAQEAFKNLVPDDENMHMVNHVSGLYIYTHEGIGGINDCRFYFTGSCYHGFVSALIADKGLGDLHMLADICAQTSTLEERLACAHGLGHGLSEGVDYDMFKALSLCSDMFTASSSDRQFCFYGVAMENREATSNLPSPGRLYNPNDPMYPCDSPQVVAIGAHKLCWVTQSQIILKKSRYPSVIDGDVGKAARYCETLSDTTDLNTCFTGLAAQVFFRLNDAAAKNGATCSTQYTQQETTICQNDVTPASVQNACAPISNPQERNVCIWRVYRFKYYFGDHSPETMGLCTTETGTEKDECYREAFYLGIATTYFEEPQRAEACKTLPEAAYARACVAWMQSPAAPAF